MEAVDKKDTRKQREIRELKIYFLKILMGVFLVVFLASGGVLLNYYINYRQAQSQKNELVTLYASLKTSSRMESGEGEKGEGSEELSAEENEVVFGEMKKLNPDYIAWLSIADTGINYPVVYKDNSYYLNHNFEGKKDSHGTIFLDEGCSMEDTFLLVHGHHMKDGTMFGGLKHYNEADFRESHRQISFETEWGDDSYTVFAVMRIDLTREDHFKFYEMPQTEDEAEQYLDQVRRNAMWKTDYDFDFDSNRILLLSTCEYGTKDERLVVLAVH